MSKFTNAYYVTYTFNDYPFFMGPYDVYESAKEGYDKSVAESNLQIIEVQIIR